jgi:hypothetical protein
MAKAMKKVKVASNPNRKRPSAKNSRPGKATRKGNHSHMTKNKKRASNNPKRKRKSNNPHRRRRRNPGIMANAKEFLMAGATGLASAVATSQLPQLILGADNTSFMGYAANIATAVAATFLANSMLGPRAGEAAMVGGAVIVLDRFLTENVSAIGPYISLSGVGDATAARMGTIRDGYYLHPTMVDGSGNMIVPQPVTDASVAAVLAKYPQIAAPLAAAMNSGKTTGAMGAVNPSSLRRHMASGQLLSSRFQGRFNQALN